MKSDLILKLFGIILIVSILSLVTSCKKEDPIPTFIGQGNIGTHGGIVKTADGAYVEIPAGALNSNQYISLVNVTREDTIANGGSKIYELKPDGLIFSDSVILTLPFDDKYLNQTGETEKSSVGIIVFTNNSWVELKSSVDFTNKTVTVKTNHFSYYAVYNPWKWSNYFRNNKSNSSKKLNVPHYYQGDSKWCAYFSFSMAAKYAGYSIKGPTFASLFGETSCNGFQAGMGLFSEFSINKKLNSIGIETEIANPSWADVEEMSGYILKQIEDGRPVIVGSHSQGHAFVVTGHTPDGFYVNDPSGYLLEKIFGTTSVTENDLANVLITYDKFKSVLKTWRDSPLIAFGKGGLEATYVIKSKGAIPSSSASINFPPGFELITIQNSEGSDIGKLDINGNYKPIGYSLINTSISTPNNIFNGTDYIRIIPVLSNSSNLVMDAIVYFKIDNVFSENSTTISISPKNTFQTPTTKKIQFSNLSVGNHILYVELRSQSNSNILYDSWDFPFKIASEFIDNGNPPSIPVIVSPNNGAKDVIVSPILSWNCSDPDGDPLTYDVYFGVNNSSLPLVSQNLTSNTYTPNGPLANGVTFYWKIIAKDNHSNSITGGPWSFTTIPSSGTIPTNGLVAYFPFNGNANDEIGNDNNGIVNSASLTTDRFDNPNSAYNFSASNNSIVVNNLANFPKGNEDRTLSLWVYSNNYKRSGNAMIAGWGYPSSNQMSALVLGLGNIPSGKPGFWGWANDFEVNNVLTDGYWHNIVFTYKNNTVTIYINSNNLGSKTITSLNTSTQRPFYIGYFTTTMHNFVGKIDDVRVFNKALSDSEVQSLYHEGGW